MISMDGREAIPVWSIEGTFESLDNEKLKEKLYKYAIDQDGTVYYWNDGIGEIINGVAYYKKDIIRKNPYTATTIFVEAVTKVEK